VIETDVGHCNVRRVFDLSGLDKNIPFITDFVMKELKHWVSNTFSPVQWMVLHMCFPNDKTYHVVGAVFFVSLTWD
jgi:hypothetical protein